MKLVIAPGETHRNTSNDVLIFRFLLKNAFAVSKSTFTVTEYFLEAGLLVNRLYRFYHIFDLYAVSADVLHRCGTSGTRDQRKIFDASIVVSDAVHDQLMPVFSRTRKHGRVIIGFVYGSDTFELHARYHTVIVACEQHVTAPTQY